MRIQSGSVCGVDRAVTMHGKHEQMLTLTISAYGWFLVHGFISDWFERMCYAPVPRAWETEEQMTKPLPPNSWKDWIIALTPNHTHTDAHMVMPPIKGISGLKVIQNVCTLFL